MPEFSDKEIKIVSAPDNDKPYVIIDKPHGLPSAPISENDKNNALSKACEIYPEINNVHGKKEIEKGLVHRLDTVTKGLLLIATTQDFYDKITKLQNEGKFIKYYKALCNINAENVLHFEGFPALNRENVIQIKENFETTVSSYFRPFGKGNKEVRPVTKNSSTAALKKLKNPVLYETTIKIISANKEKNQCEVLCKISKGFRHQVRNHLAWIGLPVINDPVYNCESIGTEKEIEFEAVKLEF